MHSLFQILKTPTFATTYETHSKAQDVKVFEQKVFFEKFYLQQFLTIFKISRNMNEKFWY